VQPVFLELAEVVAIHADQIERYGGAAGIRDIGLLRSAVAVPRSTFAGRLLHEDLCEMAAAYLFHIIRNHAFLDGNKRTGLVAAVVFLALNGVDVAVGERGLERIVRAVAEGRAGKAEITAFFRKHTVI
jgi:death-on-curing protein